MKLTPFPFFGAPPLEWDGLVRMVFNRKNKTLRAILTAKSVTSIMQVPVFSTVHYTLCTYIMHYTLSSLFISIQPGKFQDQSGSTQPAPAQPLPRYEAARGEGVDQGGLLRPTGR